MSGSPSGAPQCSTPYDIIRISAFEAIRWVYKICIRDITEGAVCIHFDPKEFLSQTGLGQVEFERMWRVAGALLLSWVVLAQEPATNARTAEAAAAPTTITTNARYKIPENRILEFTVPLTREAKLALAAKNQVVEYAKVAIAVPRNFDPELPNPILLVSGTSDGDGSSIRIMPAFTNIALRLGWVVIAADGPFGKAVIDNPAWRWALISSLLEHIHKTWPRSRRWPIATAGVSGGGKWSGVIGAILANKGYNLVGVFMGAVNQDLASESAKLYEPATRYKKTPIYLSSGAEDKIATPQHHDEVKQSLQKNGFSTVRLESFEGGHALSEMELRKALGWFLEEYATK